MSKETTLKKEFSERDLQRIRNLATKKVNDKTVTSVGYSKAEEFHEEGDVWEENGRTWTIKNGIKRTVRKTDAHTVPFLCPKCSKPMKHQFDKRMYAIHQMCLHCTTEMESELKMQGKYEEYEQDMIRKIKPRYNKPQGKSALKITPEQYQLAQEMREGGKYYHEIADEIGVSTMTVYRALNNQTKNIGEDYAE